MSQTQIAILGKIIINHINPLLDFSVAYFAEKPMPIFRIKLQVSGVALDFFWWSQVWSRMVTLWILGHGVIESIHSCNRLNSFPALEAGNVRLQSARGTCGCRWCGRSGRPFVDDTSGIVEGPAFTNAAAVWCAIGTRSTKPRGAGLSRVMMGQIIEYDLPFGNFIYIYIQYTIYNYWTWTIYRWFTY